MSQQVLLVLYTISILATGIGIGYFIKGLRVELKILSLKIEVLEKRLERIENKLIKG